MSPAADSRNTHPHPRQRRLSVSGAAAVVVVVRCWSARSGCLRLPMMVQPMGIDQGIFTAAAWGMSQGDMLYRDLWDQKPPGIHLIYRAAIAVLGPHEVTVFWMDFLAAVATTALLGVVGWRLARPSVGLAAAAVYAVLGVPTMRYGAGGFLERAVPETFIAVCVLAAAALLLCAAADADVRARGRVFRLRGAAQTDGADLLAGDADRHAVREEPPLPPSPPLLKERGDSIFSGAPGEPERSAEKKRGRSCRRDVEAIARRVAAARLTARASRRPSARHPVALERRRAR